MLISRGCVEAVASRGRLCRPWPRPFRGRPYHPPPPHDYDGPGGNSHHKTNQHRCTFFTHECAHVCVCLCSRTLVTGVDSRLPAPRRVSPRLSGRCAAPSCRGGGGHQRGRHGRCTHWCSLMLPSLRVPHFWGALCPVAANDGRRRAVAAVICVTLHPRARC